MDNVLEYPVGVAQPAPSSSSEPGQIVVVRAAVVENADHVFGNLFQRVYSSVGRVQALDPEEGERLQDSVREVEDALQLVLDYIAPFPPAFERFAVAEVAESLRLRLAESAGLEVGLRAVDPASAVMVLADPVRLGRAFDLLALRLAESARGSCVTADVEVGRSSVALHVAVAAAPPAARSSIGDLRWAVAEKLIEMQGGTLEQRGDGGGYRWTVSLPREP